MSRAWKAGALGVLAVVALFFFGRLAGDYVPGFVARVEALGAWGPLALVAAYLLGTVAFVPGSILTLAAGALFGLVRGTAYAFAGATLGAAAAFLIARYLARRPVEKRIGDDPRFRRLDESIGREGRRVVFLLRLSPVFPFALLNYALGLTRVSFADYLVASVGMLPGTLLYVYQGVVVGEITSLGAAGVERGAGYYVVLFLGLVATVVVTVLVTRLARRALSEENPDAVAARSD